MTLRILATTLAGTVLVVAGAGSAPGVMRASTPGPFHTTGPPPGHTGGMGEPTCQACHAEYPLNEPPGRLRVEGLPERWEPGESYPLTVQLHDRGMRAAGFQLAARWSDGPAAGRSAGTLEALSGRVAVAPADSTGVTYAQHTREGSEPASPELASWALVWTAPATPPDRRHGRIVFHAAANSANGDNSPFGDLVFTTEARVAGPSPGERSDGARRRRR